MFMNGSSEPGDMARMTGLSSLLNFMAIMTFSFMLCTLSDTMAIASRLCLSFAIWLS